MSVFLCCCVDVTRCLTDVLGRVVLIPNQRCALFGQIPWNCLYFSRDQPTTALELIRWLDF